MATRKRARNDEGQFQADDPATPAVNEAFEHEQGVSVDSLAAFVGAEQPDRERLQKALDLAKAAAATVTGSPVGDTASHPVRQGIHLLAAQLLITGQLDAEPQDEQIPLVVRYYWRLADAGRQP